MTILALVCSLFILVFGLVFLIDCIRYRKQINTYVKYGLFCGLILLVLDTGILLLVPNIFSLVPLYKIVVVAFVAFVRIVLFTCMGMYCCLILETHDVPVLRMLFDEAEKRGRLFWRNFLISIVVTVLLAVGYSIILFKLTTPQVSEALRRLTETQVAQLGVSRQPSLMITLVVLEFAFAEEIIFRLGIQNYIAKQFDLKHHGYWIAVVVTSLFWSFAHANILDPEWVKIAQIFPFGLALGFLFRKYGTELCIVIHGLFNIIMIFLGPNLITG